MGYHHKGTPKGQRNKSALTSFRLRPSTLKVTLQPCCFLCPPSRRRRSFQAFWRLQQQERERTDECSPIFLLYFKYGFITSLFLQLTWNSMDHTFTFSSNDPYTIKTNLKDENRNILQIAEKNISTISLARQHLKASKESLDRLSNSCQS